ncbi:unnamed protein product [Vitrella brassicaformis CCMP3155]|uniref:Uncharacterized protein n=3 Tax=Vitrella brassicaformis TaxID=1169539 RepID=A0A0G4GVD6_VITBC|nr:unnamed protein product [Vitrella brassicaformis CCMP3155]|eukprot:CEM34844.1 unnamed protein product [Vitrella brassicaformis CCMP3155]
MAHLQPDRLPSFFPDSPGASDAFTSAGAIDPEVQPHQNKVEFRGFKIDANMPSRLLGSPQLGGSMWSTDSLEGDAAPQETPGDVESPDGQHKEKTLVPPRAEGKHGRRSGSSGLIALPSFAGSLDSGQEEPPEAGPPAAIRDVGAEDATAKEDAASPCRPATRRELRFQKSMSAHTLSIPETSSAPARRHSDGFRRRRRPSAPSQPSHARSDSLGVKPSHEAFPRPPTSPMDFLKNVASSYGIQLSPSGTLDDESPARQQQRARTVAQQARRTPQSLAARAKFAKAIRASRAVTPPPTIVQVVDQAVTEALTALTAEAVAESDLQSCPVCLALFQRFIQHSAALQSLYSVLSKYLRSSEAAAAASRDVFAARDGRLCRLHMMCLHQYFGWIELRLQQREQQQQPDDDVMFKMNRLEKKWPWWRARWLAHVEKALEGRRKKLVDLCQKAFLDNAKLLIDEWDTQLANLTRHIERTTSQLQARKQAALAHLREALEAKREEAKKHMKASSALLSVRMAAPRLLEKHRFAEAARMSDLSEQLEARDRDKYNAEVDQRLAAEYEVARREEEKSYSAVVDKMDRYRKEQESLLMLERQQLVNRIKAALKRLERTEVEDARKVIAAFSRHQTQLELLIEKIPRRMVTRRSPRPSLDGGLRPATSAKRYFTSVCRGHFVALAVAATESQLESLLEARCGRDACAGCVLMEAAVRQVVRERWTSGSVSSISGSGDMHMHQRVGSRPPSSLPTIITSFSAETASTHDRPSTSSLPGIIHVNRPSSAKSGFTHSDLTRASSSSSSALPLPQPMQHTK